MPTGRKRTSSTPGHLILRITAARWREDGWWRLRLARQDRIADLSGGTGSLCQLRQRQAGRTRPEPNNGSRRDKAPYSCLIHHFISLSILLRVQRLASLYPCFRNAEEFLPGTAESA